MKERIITHTMTIQTANKTNKAKTRAVSTQANCLGHYNRTCQAILAPKNKVNCIGTDLCEHESLSCEPVITRSRVF